MKKILLSLVAAASVFLSGCSFSGFANIEDSLVSPTLSKNQKEIYEVLEKSAGKNIKLKYPSSGDSVNAIIMRDLDSDGVREAIVFYQLTDIEASANINIMILAKKNDQWSIMSEIDGAGSDIDKICFGSLGVKGSGFFVVGYNLTNRTEKEMIVYAYNGTSVITDKTHNYNQFEVMDIDENGKDEILFLANEKKTNNPYAYLLSENNEGGFSIESKTATNVEVYEYVKLVQGILDDGRPALYMDGKNSSGLYMTEILAAGDNGLENLLYSDDLLISNQTLRDSITIEDVNGDDIYEIPQSYYLGDDEYSQQRLTDWYYYKDGEFEKVMSSYVNSSDDFIFSFPEEWEYKIGVTKDDQSRETSFIAYKDGKSTGNVVLKIITMKKSDAQLNPPEDCSEIKSNGQLVYYAYVPPDVQSKFSLTLTQIKINLITTR